MERRSRDLPGRVEPLGRQAAYAPDEHAARGQRAIACEDDEHEQGDEVSGRCETCRWWNGTQDATFPLRRPCERMSSDETAREYAEDGALANAVGAYGYNAEVLTLPNFGCVMWEAK